ncbi:hypothetical protein BV401_01840 [Streptomyces malaysiensis subsp. malaysiensis]|uniref:Uncharacterized protein n=1 Tax=Streptomyces autolyticus TaxID=75293 RepID=A0ABM6HPI6_9ACTN|nr:hypothetical protein BV401_01840 [Streptomyces autolyticus]
MAVHDTRTGVLILRVWWEPEQTPALRARLLVAINPQQAPAVYSVAAGLDDVCDQVRAWLQEWSRNMEAPDK